jgi:DNA polymerase, archaea type
MKDFEGLYLVDYDIEYNTNEPIVWLFSRLKNGEKKIEKVRGFKPYFYVDKDFLIKGEEGYKNIFGKEVKKITFVSPKEIYDLRQHIKSKGFNHYEADILYNNRFLIDNVNEIIKTDYRRFYIDIETLSEGGFPDIDTTQQPVVCLTIYDTLSKIYYTWIWRKDFETNLQNIDNKQIRKFKSERDMLIDVIDFFAKEKPDIILGWNVAQFDIKYLMNRMKNIFDLNVRRLSPINIAFITKDQSGQAEGKIFKGTPVIKGIVIFDLLNYYRKMHKGELSSYSLNSIAQEELKEEKTDSHHVVDADWVNDYENVIRYNLKDVELTFRIDDKVGVFDFFDQMRTIAHVNVDDCKYYGRVVDTFILRYAKQKNIVLPSKKDYIVGESKLEGGFVQEPKVGLYKNVIVIDLNSIYPNLINTFNLSPECRKEDGNIIVNNIKFCEDEKGIIPSVLDELGILRSRFKHKMKELRYGDDEFKLYDAKQQAAKNLACTVYGVNALSSFRLNTDYVAQTITYLGRTLINWIKDRIEKDLGYEVLYIDTDSNFIKLDDKLTKEECIVKGREIEKYVNEHLEEFAQSYGVKKKHTLKVEFEKLYQNLILLAKKRYAGWVIYKDGKVDDAIQMVGIDARRSDSSKISKNIQKQVIEMILRNKDSIYIIDYVKDMIEHIKKENIEDIAIPVKFEKNLNEYPTNIPRVRGARWANENLKTNYNAGSKILMLYTLKPVDVICFESYRQLKDIEYKVDYALMLNKLIFMKIRKIFEAIGWNINNLETYYMHNNKTLDEWL